MTLLATSFSFSLRTEARLATGVVDRARGAAAAEAGLRRMMLHMAQRNVRALSAGTAEMTFDGIPVTVEATPENARIDLNAAPPALLEGLIARAAALSGEDVAADAVTDAIMDWRDNDDDPRPKGAEASDYEAAGRVMMPRNGAFLSVSELAQVAGVTPGLFAALRPLVTVHAWSPQVDPMSAPRDVLLSVPGLGEAEVDAFLAQRAEPDANRARLTRALQPAQRYLARASSVVYAITARADVDARIRVVRRAVVKFNANKQRPLSIVAWYHDALTPEPGQAPAEEEP